VRQTQTGFSSHITPSSTPSATFANSWFVLSASGHRRCTMHRGHSLSWTLRSISEHYPPKSSVKSSFAAFQTIHIRTDDKHHSSFAKLIRFGDKLLSTHRPSGHPFGYQVALGYNLYIQSQSTQGTSPNTGFRAPALSRSPFSSSQGIHPPLWAYQLF